MGKCQKKDIMGVNLRDETLSLYLLNLKKTKNIIN